VKDFPKRNPSSPFFLTARSSLRVHRAAGTWRWGWGGGRMFFMYRRIFSLTKFNHTLFLKRYCSVGRKGKTQKHTAKEIAAKHKAAKERNGAAGGGGSGAAARKAAKLKINILCEICKVRSFTSSKYSCLVSYPPGGISHKYCHTYYYLLSRPVNRQSKR